MRQTFLASLILIGKFSRIAHVLSHPGLASPTTHSLAFLPPLIHPTSGIFEPLFPWIFIKFSIFAHACTRFGHPPHPPCSIRVLPSLYGQGLFRRFTSSICPLDFLILSDFQHFRLFSSTFHQLFDFLHTHTPVFAHHHPPRAAITLHPSLAT